MLFRVLEKLVIKSDFQNVRFVNKVKFWLKGRNGADGNPGMRCLGIHGFGFKIFGYSAKG